MKLFFLKRTKEKQHNYKYVKTIYKSSSEVIREAANFWYKAQTPIQPEYCAILKLEKLHEKWIKLKIKNKNSQRTRERRRKRYDTSFKGVKVSKM